MSSIDKILDRLLSLHPDKLIDLSLGRMQRLLADLGHPERQLPPVIHVAGTNGKGSTVAYCRAFLEAAGQTVHTFTSPHLVQFRERIRLGGTLVTNRRLSVALEHCEKVNAGRPITYFEITTAAAFYLFAEHPADYLLLEVGLGGRFDATNVVDNPKGIILTPISIDHVEFLGDTLAAIAREKAGIMKSGAPAVVARQEDETLTSINGVARSLGITPFIAGEDFDGFNQNGRLVYQDEKGLLDLPPPGLAGPFQFNNATVAIAAMRHFELPVSEQDIVEGLNNVEWPARLMPIKQGALRDLLPASHELWLDGGHNEAGGRVVAEAVMDMQKVQPRPLILIMGTFANKDAKGFLTHFGDMPQEVFTVKVPATRASWKARDLADIAIGQGLPARPMRSVRAALLEAAKVSNARVMICGALFLAGDVLRQNKTPPN